VRSFGCAFFVLGGNKMDMYKKMYYHLFNAVTDAIEENNIDDIKKLLIKAQQETEEIYISWEETKEIIDNRE
jgi:hypothetical protein